MITEVAFTTVNVPDQQRAKDIYTGVLARTCTELEGTDQGLRGQRDRDEPGEWFR